MDISFASRGGIGPGALVVGILDGGGLTEAAAAADEATGGAVTRALSVSRFKGQAGHSLELLAPAGVKASRIVLAGLGKTETFNSGAAERLAATALGRLLVGGEEILTFAIDLPKRSKLREAELAAHLALGASLRSYRFDQYRKVSEDETITVKKIVVSTREAANARRAWAGLSAVGEGIFLARDLVNEPANILYPDEFAKRTQALKKLGVKVEVLDVPAMQKLGMNALLGVGQGSEHESRTVIMRWNGGKRGAAPLAFIGKGVCFDSGGISIKPAASMEDMKGDMAGAACVVGLMHALAARKAKVNAVGAIGIVENMPDGRAQRPGDIVTTMSGQTIEIINTDAEGRLVLSDVLHYVNKHFKPKFMIDLATLTGAIIVALGQEYAGLFANDDKLAERLVKAGNEIGERVWRMPLGPEYDKMIDSKFADMKNTGGRHGGAITAAQLLQRFVDKTPWAHLDIAGTAMGSPQSEINRSWGSGFGVRLLDRLVAEYYEK